MKEKNYIYKSFIFVLLIASVFGGLSLVNTEYKLWTLDLKPVDMFSDIIADDTEQEDSLTLQPVANEVAKVEADTCPEGVVCIQNFTDTPHPLDNISAKLFRAKQGREKVRIAWFGDSFTDADLVVCDLRDTLQSVFGGNGVGFVPITHEAAGYRRSIIHTFGGWKTSSVIHRKGNNNFGISGYCYRPDSMNFVRFAASKRYKHTRRFDIFRLFYTSEFEFDAKVAFNDSVKHDLTLEASTQPQMLSLSLENIQKVRVKISKSAHTTIFGASLEDSTGIYIDNFSIKGNSGISLLSIPDNNLRTFDSLLNYDLIVLQFGLNVITPESRKYTSYLQGMEKLVKKFRENFPGTPILLLSVSDRSERRNGQFVTMKAVKSLVAAQERFAYNQKLLFWNMYEAMGGENSMAAFVNSNPPLASKDYTHMSFEGGKIIGHKLAKSILYESEKYAERRNQFVQN